MRYVKSLNGIRGIAVLLVMLFHYGYFGAGWIGVQIFFTLSGYLITTILIENRGLPFHVYVGRFYWRRALRIFPLFYGFLAIVAVTYALYGLPDRFRLDWIWLLTYSANFARMRDGDLGPWFVHIWSLAVEMQFYLIWPVLLFLVPARWLRWVVAALLLLTPIIRSAMFQALLGAGYDTEYAGKGVYVLPFGQLDAFAAGAAIPIWGLHRIKNIGRIFAAVAAVTIASGVAVLAKAHFLDGGAFFGSLGYQMYLVRAYGYIWGYSLINVLAMLAIICALQGIGIARTLEDRTLVRIGQISYGMYVYHLPLLIAGELLIHKSGIGGEGLARPAFFAAWVAVVILVSEGSFSWIEAPFLKLKDATRAPGDTTLKRKPV